MAAAPKRKAKQMLTVIPEQERPISYRFTVVVVGENAAEYSKLAVSSEMAEAYKPKKAQKPVEELVEIKEDEGGEGTHAETTLAHSPSGGGAKSHDRPTDEHIMFCPTGPNSKDLCRLRLQPCSGFADSIPLAKDENQAKYLIVVLLFWDVKKDNTDDTIREWYSRMAEINHKEKSLRPYPVVMAYEADDEQEQSLKNFTEKMKGVGDPILISDASEDSITESLQDLAEAAIQRSTRAVRNSSIIMPGDLPLASRARCCSIS